MNLFRYYAKGVSRASSQPKLVFVIWLFNILFGAFAYFRLNDLFSETIGRSLVAEKLIKRFEFSFLSELLVHHGDKVGGVFSSLILVALFYFLVSIFLAGGILNMIKKVERPFPGEEQHRTFASVFFQGGGKYYGRFFRLLIYSVILWVFFIGVLIFLYKLGGSLSEKGAKENVMVVFSLITPAVAVVLFNGIRMILDYARIRIVAEDTNQVFKTLFQSVGFVFKRLFRTSGLYYSLVLTGLVIFLAYRFLDGWIPKDAAGLILAGFILGQVFIFLRGWLKVAFQAGQYSFYLDHRR